MVNTLSHFGIGLLIASLAKLEGRQKKLVLFLAILPDLDFISSIVFRLIDGRLDHQMHNLLFYLLEHREFMHSFLFIFLVLLAVHYYERNVKFTLVSGAAIFSHFYLDYATSWKMRPFFPFDTSSSIMGSMDFFDPVVTIISFIPIYLLLHDRYKESKKDDKKTRDLFNANKKYPIQNRIKLNQFMIIILVLWCVLTPVSKSLLINHISEMEGTDISYQNSYPKSFGTFVSAYSYNQTHYKIMESGYVSGMKKTMFIPKITGDENKNDFYVQRAKELYATSLPGEIDYPVYNVSSNENFITVSLSDARNPYTLYWAYFKTDYIFVFDRHSDDYSPYIRRQMDKEEPLAKNWFE